MCTTANRIKYLLSFALELWPWFCLYLLLLQKLGHYHNSGIMLQVSITDCNSFIRELKQRQRRRQRESHLTTSFPGFFPTLPQGKSRREPWERGWSSQNRNLRYFNCFVTISTFLM